jgi:hypothetical protein
MSAGRLCWDGTGAWRECEREPPGVKGTEMRDRDIPELTDHASRLPKYFITPTPSAPRNFSNGSRDSAFMNMSAIISFLGQNFVVGDAFSDKMVSDIDVFCPNGVAREGGGQQQQ